MNRSVLERQMFRNGGAVFPDLSGDGQVTRKDILMGRGVLPMQEGGSVPISGSERRTSAKDTINAIFSLLGEGKFNDREAVIQAALELDKAGSEEELTDLRRTIFMNYAKTSGNFPYQGAVLPSDLQDKLLNFQIGDSAFRTFGMPYDDRKPQAAEPPRRMQEGGMVPMAMGAPEAPAGLPAAVGAPGPEQVDPAMMEQMLQQAATQFADVEQAGDYEEMMNAIRGDQQSIGQRRQELASLVGEEDAQETPESVLTLLQPVMQLAAIDQGIGGLAEDVMGGAVEGPMAEGIMSTVNMGGPEPAAPGPAMPMEGGAPVQAFRYGGAVRMAEGGDPRMARIQELMPQYQSLYGDLLGGTPAEDLAEQRRLTQAQALFDIAQAGFAFAQPGSRRQSPVSRLGEAITETQLFPKIGARAAELKGFEREQERQKRALDLSALQGAMGQAESERTADAARAAERRKFAFDLLLEEAKAGKKIDPRVVLTNNDLRERFAAGTTDAAEDLLVQQVIAEYTTPQPAVWDPERQTYVQAPKKQLAPQWTEALEARGVIESGAAGEEPPEPSGVVSPTTGTEAASFLPGQRPGTSMELATGSEAAIGEAFNTIAGIFGGEVAPQSEQAITALRTLNTDTVLGILQARGQRDNQQLQSQIRDLFPEAGSFFTSDQRAAAKTRSVVDMLNNDLTRLQRSLQPENAKLLKPGDIAEKRESLNELTQYRSQYMRLLQDLERRLQPEMTANELDAFYQGNQ